MDAHDRAGDPHDDTDVLRALGECAEHRPHERRVSLLVEPRVEVVGDRHEVEPTLLGHLRDVEESGRVVLFTGEGESELHRQPVPHSPFLQTLWVLFTVGFWRTNRGLDPPSPGTPFA